LACGSSGCWSTGSCATNFRRWTRTPDACLGRLYAVVPSQFIGLCFQDIPLPLAHLYILAPGPCPLVERPFDRAASQLP
jgi:hypothetical protein